jgi:hypothetical protein
VAAAATPSNLERPVAAAGMLVVVLRGVTRKGNTVAEEKTAHARHKVNREYIG